MSTGRLSGGKKESQKKWLSFAPKWGTPKGILCGLTYATCVLLEAQ
jgi:hypothetical protein